jgi:hypothetical protein
MLSSTTATTSHFVTVFSIDKKSAAAPV